MAKTEETLLIENSIYRETSRQGVFGCFEVTIGWFGKERVDYMTYDTKGIWRCYEIKVSKADFHSKANITFVGNYNYYVVPQSLYEEIKAEIPADIGCYVAYQSSERWFCSCVKRAKRKELAVDQDVLKDSFIRSLSREYSRKIKSGDVEEHKRLQRQVKELTRSRDEYRSRYQGLEREVVERHGGDWRWRKKHPLPSEIDEEK